MGVILSPALSKVTEWKKVAKEAEFQLRENGLEDFNVVISEAYPTEEHHLLKKNPGNIATGFDWATNTLLVIVPGNNAFRVISEQSMKRDAARREKAKIAMKNDPLLSSIKETRDYLAADDLSSEMDKVEIENFNTWLENERTAQLTRQNPTGPFSVFTELRDDPKTFVEMNIIDVINQYIEDAKITHYKKQWRCRVNVFA